jgi:hypothetical protein
MVMSKLLGGMKSEPKRKKAALFRVRPSRKLEAVYVFSLVVGHGATHRRH